MDKKSIGRHIQIQREHAKLTQNQLAELTDLSQSYISAVERGQKIPSLEKFIDIANALNTTADILLVEVIKSRDVTRTTVIADMIDLMTHDEQNKLFEIIKIMLAK